MKMLLAIAMLLAIVGLWQYNEKMSAASEAAALAAKNHKPFNPVGTRVVRSQIAAVESATSQAVASEPARTEAVGPPPPRFRCDGRTHCSHMSSCEEAKYFIQNCPNTAMDGNNDGVPCERQWC